MVQLSGDTVAVSGGGIHVYTRDGGSWPHRATIPGWRVAFEGTTLIPVSDVGLSTKVYKGVGAHWVHVHDLLPSYPSPNVTTWNYRAAGISGLTAVLGTAWTDTWTFILPATYPEGTPCLDGSTCDTGFCIDNVCCDTTCGGGAVSDCQACSVAAGGTADGVCGPLSDTAAPLQVCRSAVAACDAVEVCSAASTTCPADSFRAAGQACRPAAGGCDLVETCDGTSAGCPPDAYANSSVVCRPLASDCDVVEVCGGSGPTCPANIFASSGTACPGSGFCDGIGTCVTTCVAGAPCSTGTHASSERSIARARHRRAWGLGSWLLGQSAARPQVPATKRSSATGLP